MFLIGVFFLFFSNIEAQNSISISFRDGSSINGYGRIKTNDRILIRRSKNADKEIYDYKTVRRLRVNYGDTTKDYEYKVLKDGRGPGSVKLLHIIQEGNVDLYQVQHSGMIYPSTGFSNTGFATTTTSSTTYYMSESESDLVVNLRIGNTYSRRFRKIAKEYFGDCEELLKKIKLKHFERYDVESVVKYYNEFCDKQ
ncbi:hypothetical protein [Psychroflexus aestuariivivens]|uniref:hypothetical protein n=1 Tax=Psychroflexus aestuariivivens TaxID=1795040 RepID=UPI000FD81F88|nr:hypothetical protein [Psychroflexus aestuariivivens]